MKMASSAIQSQNMRSQRSISHAGFPIGTVGINTEEEGGQVQVVSVRHGGSPSDSTADVVAVDKSSVREANNLSFHPLKSYKTGNVNQSNLSIMTEIGPVFTTDSPTKKNNNTSFIVNQIVNGNRNLLMADKPIRASKSTLDLPNFTEQEFSSVGLRTRDRNSPQLYLNTDIAYINQQDDIRRRHKSSNSPSPATTPKSLPDVDSTHNHQLNGDGSSAFNNNNEENAAPPEKPKKKRSFRIKKSNKDKDKDKDKENKGAPPPPPLSSGNVKTKNSSSGKATPEITVDKCDDGQEENEEDADDEEPRIGSLEWCRVRGPSAFSGLMCTGEIGPAIAVGLNIGSSIITSNGIPIAGDQILLKDANIVPVPVSLLPMTEATDSSDTEAVIDSDLRKELERIPVVVSQEALDTGGESPVPEEPPPICPFDHSIGKEMLNTIIPCNIDQLFTMLFTNSKFYLDFQLSRKTSDINQSEWQLGDGSQKTRQLTFTVQTGQSLGPKSAQVTETQTLLPESRPGLLYAIQSESVNAGIPYADCFAVHCHYCLTKISATEANLVVISKIHYKKSTWAKTFIEKNSMSALADFFAGLEKALKEECAKMNAGGVTPTSPIVTSCMLPRRRHHRKKCRAPDIPVTALPRPMVETTLVHPVGSRPTISTAVSDSMTTEPVYDSTENSLAMKIILAVLGCLLLLNAFLYFKLSSLETAASMHSLFPATVQFSGETPQTHQEWLMVLQQQETLHQTEVQSWHEILVSAIKVLHQAEKDLENLKTHIANYGMNNIVAKPVIPAHDALDLLSSMKSQKADSISRDRDKDSEEVHHPENDSNNNVAETNSIDPVS